MLAQVIFEGIAISPLGTSVDTPRVPGLVSRHRKLAAHRSDLQFRTNATQVAFSIQHKKQKDHPQEMVFLFLWRWWESNPRVKSDANHIYACT